jgi:formate hydrogenlyase subunit 3/multisubunit Na+/H+ antiporter MnhD subunit
MMLLIYMSMAALIISGILTVGVSAKFGIGGAVIGSGLGLIAGFGSLLTGATTDIQFPWFVPGGVFHIGLDPLSSFFLIPITLLGGVCAVYGAGYLKGHGDPKGAGLSWFHYNLLLASMMMVVLARNGILFLIAWETMALASFFLVTFENGKAHVRTAGWVYMVATHLGTAFLLALFTILGEKSGSFEFDAWAQTGMTLPASLTGLAFVFALIGFGAKAGYIPVHVWLPEAHPAAPSHVSALMSGVMIKTGVYGLLRIMTCLGTPAPWWGWCLLAMGLTSGVLGVLFAIAQHDIKRLLAYHSVENIGIITIGLGVGYIGLAYGFPAMAVLGFAGGLLHVLNHAIFKGLLFLGAGSVIHATGTGDLEHLGGLLKRMRFTGVTFLIGAVAICGLPPLNGFVSEFLIYFGAFTGVASSPSVVVGCFTAIAGLALIGGLAAACFAKAFGVVFLGEPRSEHAMHAHEASAAMTWPMMALAALCILIGAFAPRVAMLLYPAVGLFVKGAPETAAMSLGFAANALSWIVMSAGILACLVAGLILLRKRLLARRAVTESSTWDCGYARPTARMQYTASSFAQPLTNFFAPVLRTRQAYTGPDQIFPPTAGSFSTETKDLFRNEFYDPLFERTASALAWFRKAQHGRVQLYVLYIALTLIALLIFEM